MTTSPALYTYTVQQRIAVIALDSPPVNALGHGVREGIVNGVKKANQDSEVDAIILICKGRTFCAGADIREFGKPPQQPDLRDVIETLEASTKLTVAALHGTALGGGLELALGCNYRLALPSTKVGLPEVNLGLLPGAGGTQKLPRIVGVPVALDIITSGRMLEMQEAHKLRVVDQLASSEDLLAEALSYTQQLLQSSAPLIRVRDRNELIEKASDSAEIFANFRQKNARKFRGYLAPECIIQCIETAIKLPFEQGMKFEREKFVELMSSTEAAAQRHSFFAERETSKVPDIPKDLGVRPINSAAVIGAGTMGGGIAMNFLNAGIPVTLMEQAQDALDRGLSVIRKNYERSLKGGRISAEQLESRMSLITPTIDINELASVDLIIEAVFESMAVKKEVFTNIDAIAKQGCILASNTSYLDINEIAEVTSRPQDVVGLHFFSPANVMPLLEVVRGAKTDLEVVNTAMRLAKTIKKVPVLSRVGWGFIANRVMKPRALLAGDLILQGVNPEAVDRVIYEYGFAMGPFAMKDLVGLDVTNRDSTERTVESLLVEQDRLGQKKNGGYYDYDENRNSTLSPIALEAIKTIAQEKDVEQITADDDEILARLLYPVINEGAKVLDEGIALRASDIDVACIKGYNWPVYRGGPMFWANTVGLDKVLARLQDFEQRFGEAFTPSPYLVKLVAEGKEF